jgi:hypothetical protein
MTDDEDTAYTLMLKAFREELEEIGRIERSIQPSALVAYTTLLNCQEVRRRVGHRPTETELTQAAHMALQDAIKALPTARDRLIAEAVMAATPEYEGHNVDERKRILDERADGCSVNVYKRRRPQILEYITKYLMPRKPERSESASDITGYTESLENLKCLVVDTARLRHHFIAYLFTTMLNTQPRNNNPSTMQHHQRSINDALYKVYVELILSAGYCLDDAPYSDQTKMLANLPPVVLSEVSKMIEQVFALMPYDSSTRKVLCENRYGRLLGLARYRNRLAVLWTALWNPWTQENLQSNHADIVVTACNQLLLLGRESLKIYVDNVPLTDEIRGAVAAYYGLTPSATIVNDESLQERLEQFILDQDVAMTYRGQL